MENQDILDSGLTSGKELSLNAAAKDYLLQTAKWAKFLSIVSIVFAVLIIIIGLAFGSVMKYFMAMSPIPSSESAMADSSSAMIMVGIIYAIMGLLMMYPGIRLFQFATQSKNALDTNDSVGIENGLKRLRSVFRFYGILTIIMLSFYGLAILGMMVGMSALK